MAGRLAFAELAAGRDCFFLMDVRCAEDCATAHVEGAKEIPLTELADHPTGVPAPKIRATMCGKDGG